MINDLKGIAAITLGAKFIDDQIVIDHPTPGTGRIVVGLDGNTIVAALHQKDGYTSLMEVTDGRYNDMVLSMKIDQVISKHLFD